LNTSSDIVGSALQVCGFKIMTRLDRLEDASDVALGPAPVPAAVPRRHVHVTVLASEWEKFLRNLGPMINVFQLLFAIASAAVMVDYSIRSTVQSQQVDRSMEFVRMFPEHVGAATTVLDRFLDSVGQAYGGPEGGPVDEARLDRIVARHYARIVSNGNGSPAAQDGEDFAALAEHRLRLFRAMHICIEEGYCDENTILTLLGDRILTYYLYLRPLYLCESPLDRLDVAEAMAALARAHVRQSPEATRDDIAFVSGCAGYRQLVARAGGG
jgi:hypothetical protein